MPGVTLSSDPGYLLHYDLVTFYNIHTLRQSLQSCRFRTDFMSLQRIDISRTGDRYLTDACRLYDCQHTVLIVQFIVYRLSVYDFVLHSPCTAVVNVKRQVSQRGDTFDPFRRLFPFVPTSSTARSDDTLGG